MPIEINVDAEVGVVRARGWGELLQSELMEALGELGLDERALTEGQKTRRAAAARDRRAQALHEPALARRGRNLALPPRREGGRNPAVADCR